MEHLAVKYERIKHHLACKYVESNRGMILSTKNPEGTRRAIIKQETKGVKSEIVKNEDGTLIKREEAQ